MQATPKTDRARWQEPLACVAIFLLTFPFIYFLSKNGFDPHHTGLMYKGALDVANGKILFLETFTQYGALTTYIQALFLLIFGKRVTSILLATALFYAFDFILLYRISRRFLSRTLSLVGTGITLLLAPFYFEVWFFHPWSSVFALTFLMLALLFLLLTFEKSGRITWAFAALAGLSAALAFWCRQPVGLVTVLGGVLCIGFLAIFQKSGRKQNLLLLLFFLAGVLAGVLLLLVPILLTGAFADFVRQSIGGMFSFAADVSHADTDGAGGLFSHLFYSLFSSPFYNAYHIWADPVFTLLPLVALFIALGVAIRIIIAAKRQEEIAARDILLLLYGVFTVANWHQYYPVPCYRHWFWGAFLCVPAVLLLLRWGIQALAKFKHFAALAKPRLACLALTLSLLVIFGGSVGLRVINGAQKSANALHYGEFSHPTYEHLDGLYLNEKLATHYTQLFDAVAALEERFPDTNIINTTENGIYAVFGENFCPLFNNSGDYFYKEYPALLSAYIESARPIVIGPEAPSEDYVLYLEIAGDGGDEFGHLHKMPARIYLPAELAAQLG